MTSIPRSITITAITLGACLCAAAAPPRVAKAAPDNGDTNVDPALTELRIEFDQDMDHSGRSICGGGPLFPKIEKGIHWDGPRVILIPVSLEPDHSYSLAVNCPAAKNFRGANGESAEIYEIAFKTGKARGPASEKGSAADSPNAPDRLTPERNKAALVELRKAIDERYSYRDLRGVDWNKAFAEAAAKLDAATTPAEFARELGRVLAVAQDPHISVWVGDASFPVFRRDIALNFNLRSIGRKVPGFRQHNDCVATGKLDDGVGYILIASWGANCRDLLEPAFEALGEFANLKGLIIDVRPNGGGDELLARQFAGCFTDKPLVYSKNAYRDPKTKDSFGEPIDRVVEPNKARPQYKGKVVVLIGPACMSSNESFILMMRQAGARLLGEKTAGSSGNPKPFELSNGVRVNLPSWKDMTPSGAVLEGRGISPDQSVTADPKDFERDDPVLDAALKRLK